MAAVRALIEAAQKAVHVRRDTLAAGRVGVDAAVARLIDQLDDFDREILAGQVWALDPIPQHVIGQRLGVSATRVGRNLPRARARFAELLADPAHHEVGEYADLIRQRLGPYLPVPAADLELRRLRIDPAGQTAAVLLHAAGPYVRRDGWMDVAGTSGDQMLAAVEAVFSVEGAPATDTLLATLTSLGMPTGVALTHLETQLDLRRFGDVWVRWPGDTTAQMAEAALHLLGVPATADTIVATLRPHVAKDVSVDRAKAVLSQDDRFVRASRTTWALRQWGVTEYVNIAHAIGERIDAAGGKATVTKLTAEIRAQYPDVSEGSIRSYLGTLQFVVHRGVARRRTKADAWPLMPPLNTVRGAFRHGDNEIRVAQPVTTDLLRGSGQTVHPGVAHAAGIRPGHQRTFTSSHGPVTLQWKLTSTTGAALGSLRPHALAVDAVAGDTLVLVFRTDDATLTAVRNRPGDAAEDRLAVLVGHRPRTPAAALANALECRPEDVAAVLRARGDDDLADAFAAT